MNRLTPDHALEIADLLSPINQPMADVQAVDNSEPTPSLFGWLSDLTNGSYDAWLARGGAATSVE